MYKSVTVNGEAGVKATCLLHSVAPAGVPMVTFEIEYPRIILALGTGVRYYNSSCMWHGVSDAN